MTAEEFLKDKTNYSGLRKFATVTESDIIVWMEQYAKEKDKRIKELEDKVKGLRNALELANDPTQN